MRKPLMTKQQGFTLYMVLILMAVIAILVLAGSQLLNTEMRLSTNDADRKYAFGLAEDALRNGEQYTYEEVHQEVLLKPAIVSALASSNVEDFFDSSIVDKSSSSAMFTEACKHGLCAPSIESATTGSVPYSDVPAWERKVSSKSVFDSDETSVKYILATTAEVSKNPRYIIEYLGPAESTDTTLYRVTARAWGRNQNTQVTLQSVIRVKNK